MRIRIKPIEKEITAEEARKIISVIKEAAIGFGLQFPEVIFHPVDFEELHEVAAYTGFPGRFPHYRWGAEYEKLNTQYQFGLAKIYEMVINTDPCHVYLLKANLATDMKIVIAHVFAHADFFTNNNTFKYTNRKMLDEIANHCVKVESHIDRYGREEVEDFITQCFSLENLIDPHSPFIKRTGDTQEGDDEKNENGSGAPRLQAPRPYLDHFINPSEWTKEMEEVMKKKAAENSAARIGMKIPTEPERDILLFLHDHAPLEQWQRDILGIIREEAYYFSPQAQTKIMNEGWASYWHSKIMTGGDKHKKGEPVILNAGEMVDYADHHSGTIASHGRLNPYRLGLQIWKDIEERWNKGKFGLEWRECLARGNAAEIKNFDRKTELGREKMFEIRRIYNDVNFISEFLTDELIATQSLFHFRKYGDYFLIDSFEANKIRKQLLFQLTNFGQPIIRIEDANYGRKGELYLKHYWEGIPLDQQWAEKVLLQSLYKIWKRPVNIETVVTKEESLPLPTVPREGERVFPKLTDEVEGEIVVFHCDGTKIEPQKTSRKVKIRPVI